MIIIIKKDGQIVTDDGNPIEGKALEGAYMLLADAQDGDSIVYDGTNHMWKAGQGGGSFAPDITDPQDGDTLVYNAAQQKWVNGAGGGSGGGAMVLTIDPETGTLGKTYAEIVSATDNSIVLLKMPSEDVEDSFVIANLQQYGVYNSDHTKLALNFFFFDGTVTFIADSEDSYPVVD